MKKVDALLDLDVAPEPSASHWQCLYLNVIIEAGAFLEKKKVPGSSRRLNVYSQAVAGCIAA